MHEMTPIERTRATYAFEPLDHLIRREFSIWPEAIALWKAEQGMPDIPPEQFAEHFGWDAGSGTFANWGLGWCEPAFCPAPAERVIERGDDYEIIVDNALRTMKVFKDRRHGFMPTYVAHAVSCEADWQEKVQPLLDPSDARRWDRWDRTVASLVDARREGRLICQRSIGGYMYLRALVGPEGICYMLADNPALVHRMMQTWLELADEMCGRVQQHVPIDEFFIGEDICYNHGLLISPDMVREFLLPYYRQVLDNIARRQGRRPHFHVDTDGNVEEAIDLYRGIGMTVMSPFEVAAGCDVVAIARRYPDLVMAGGIDKRILAAGPGAIDAYLQRVIPFMVARGGYTPTCDHGVPDNVSYASYMHYRRRMLELDH